MNIKKIFIVPIFIMIFFLISGCFAKKYDGDLETRSIAQIHEDEGVPVKTTEIKIQKFAAPFRYNATVSGITESSASASVSDSVERILFRVGDYVQRDTVVIQFPQNNPSANYFQAKAAYENSGETLKRIEQLYQSGGVSRQDFDNTKTGYDVAKANWDSVNKMIHVTAPISGYITRLDVRVSENVSPGDNLFTITNYDKLVGRIWVLERDIAHVRRGLNAEAIWSGNRIPGRVTQIDLSLNPSRQAFGALIEFDNPRHTIMSGVNADINLFVYENNSTIVVEKKYLLSDNEGNFVYIKGLENTPIKRYVRTGWEHGENIEITHGLGEGEILITEGSRLITESSRIRVVAGE